MSVRVSGLSDEHAAHARKLLLQQANTLVTHKDEIHYSQRADRQTGVRHKLTITKGQFPRTCDCSSTTWWMLWDAIHRTYNVRDLVAGTSHPEWNPDGLVFTGSMYKHGKAVLHDKNLKVGDLIFYGDQGGGVPEHVAMYIGGGMVFSHGSEGGPYILHIDYRDDRRMSRRYI